jgi:hypothetical protein
MTPPTRTELRTHYKTIQDMITKERRMREAVLARSPNQAAKLVECDAALASLEILGKWIGSLLPAAAEQGALLPESEVRAPRRTY